jgi:hypothetical protein
MAAELQADPCSDHMGRISNQLERQSATRIDVNHSHSAAIATVAITANGLPMTTHCDGSCAIDIAGGASSAQQAGRHMGSSDPGQPSKQETADQRRNTQPHASLHVTQEGRSVFAELACQQPAVETLACEQPPAFAMTSAGPKHVTTRLLSAVGVHHSAATSGNAGQHA